MKLSSPLRPGPKVSWAGLNSSRASESHTSVETIRHFPRSGFDLFAIVEGDPTYPARRLAMSSRTTGTRSTGTSMVRSVAGPIISHMDYQGRIVIDPEIRFGKPCVRGTRITVGDVLSYLASGMPEDEILADFPQLTREDIRACLAFAAERERRIVSSPAA